MKKSIVVVGGGLAGLTCAKGLVEAGHRVTVLESAPFLGGRASTFKDKDGDWIEQGLHIFLGAYSEFQKVLREIEVDSDIILAWMTQIRMQDIGAEAVFGIDPLRAPVRTFTQLLGDNDYLSLKDKASVIPLVLPSVKTMGCLEDYDKMTVSEWWEKSNGNRNIYNRLVRPFCRAIQFTEPEEFSAYNFLGWMHNVAYHPLQTLVAGYNGARDHTIFAPFGAYLYRNGATIEVNARVRALEYRPLARKGRVDAVLLADGRRIEADHVVLALPAWNVHDVIPNELKGMPLFQKIAELPTAPAISVQLWFDRKVVEYQDYTMVGDSIAPVYQDQSENAYPYAGGSRLSIVISPAEPYLDLPDDEVVQAALVALGEVKAEIRSGQVVKSVVVRHRRHLVRPLPGAMTARPAQSTPVPNLWLAGDWTQQPFFGSQEGAVRGGLACATEILESMKNSAAS
ncbi:hypothetical protein DB346_22715 [Verrucomicrobia bacterium LW23]|nr:hypothetical protein DB346_22715 [Verrucomicrobia bacterium LW23]